MSREKNFTDRAVFEEMLTHVTTSSGGQYQDVATIYGDLSRLVVAMVATTPPQELQETYRSLGWGGSANVRAIHEAARHWYRTHQPDRLPIGSSDAAV